MQSSGGGSELRPFGVGEILDAGFKVYRMRFKTLCLAVLVPVVPLTIVSILLQASTAPNAFDPLPSQAEATSQFQGAALAGTVSSFLLLYLTGLLATGACVRTVAAAYLGEEVGWKESLRFAAGKLVALFVSGIIIILGLLFGLILLIVPGVFLYGRWAVATPALMIEDLGAVEGLRRSWRLVKDRFWATFGTVLLTLLIVGAVSTILNLLFIAPLFAGGSELLGGILTGFAAIISSVFTLPLQAAILTILYFDLRVRKEGLDLELLAQRIGTGTGPTGPTAEAERSTGLGGGEPSVNLDKGFGGFSAPRPPEERGTQ